MTERQIVDQAGHLKDGCGKIPCLAALIVALEKVTPARIPTLAIARMVLREATREPIDELRKLTASLLTPTMMSMAAMTTRMPTATMRISVLIVFYPYLVCSIIFSCTWRPKAGTVYQKKNR